MEPWIFSGVAVVIAVVVALGWAFTAGRKKSATEPLVLLWTAGGEGEGQLCAQRLKSLGIRVLVKNYGDSPRFTSPYAYELWVPQRDVAQARDVLGLVSGR